jgi:hypothetical protein
MPVFTAVYAHKQRGEGVVGVAPRAQYGWHQPVAVQLIFQKGGTHRQIGYLLYIIQGF